MRCRHIYVLGIIFTVLVATAAQASSGVIAKCGGSEGQGYFFSGPFVSEDSAGWQTDNISKGSTSIVEVDGKIDVLFFDASNSTTSARAQGAEVIPLGVNEAGSIFSILIVYPGEVVEIYTYNSQMKKLVHLQQKFNVIINKARIGVSNC